MDDEQDLGALARTVEIAYWIVNAALPWPQPADGGPVTVVQEQDRRGMRLEAFGQVLTELRKYEYTVRPSDLLLLRDGKIPPPRPSWWPSWWTPEVYRGSVRAIAEMKSCSRCGVPVDDCGTYKRCPRCGTAYSPVPDYEMLEKELILDALAGDT